MLVFLMKKLKEQLDQKTFCILMQYTIQVKVTTNIKQEKHFIFIDQKRMIQTEKKFGVI